MLVFQSTPEVSWALMIRRGINFLGALFALTLFAIPMAIGALLIRITLRGPIIFRQRRAGAIREAVRDVFVMYKIPFDDGRRGDAPRRASMSCRNFGTS